MSHKIIARNAGFIGVATTPAPGTHFGEEWDHTGYQYRATAEEAAQDVLDRTTAEGEPQTTVEIVNLVSSSLVLCGVADGRPPEWH